MIRLQALRKQRKMTQSQLGYYLNISRSTISQWESGKKQPSLDDMIRLSDFFQVSLDYLVGRSDNIEIERKLQENYTASTTVGDIMASVVALPDVYHDALKSILDAFLKANSVRPRPNTSTDEKR